MARGCESESFFFFFLAVYLIRETIWSFLLLSASLSNLFNLGDFFFKFPDCV